MGLLAVVSLRTANDEYRSSRALRESGAALYAAEAGANVVRGTTTDASGTTLLDSIAVTLAPGDSVDLGWKALPGGASYKAVIRRVDKAVRRSPILSVEGRGAGQWGGRRVLSVALTRTVSSLSIPGAIGMVDGTGSPPLDATFNGNNFLIEGQDASPPGAPPAGCPAGGTEKKTALSVTSQTAEDEVTASVGVGGVDEEGEPIDDQRDQLKGLGPGSTNQYTTSGSWDDDNTSTAADLQALVDALSPGATSLPTSGCVDEDGEPRVCQTEADLGTADSPAVFLADGDHKFIGNNSGYGVLMVTGDLVMLGSYAWEGLILVVGTGSATIAGSGNKVHGAILMANTQGGSTSLVIGGQAEIYYSSEALCRVEEAGLLEPLVSALAVVSGSWMQH